MAAVSFSFDMYDVPSVIEAYMERLLVKSPSLVVVELGNCFTGSAANQTRRHMFSFDGFVKVLKSKDVRLA